MFRRFNSTPSGVSRLVSLLSLTALYHQPAIAAPAAADHTLVNHVKNAGFETGLLAPWYQPLDAGGSVSVMENGPLNPPGDETPYGEYFLQLFVAAGNPAQVTQQFPLHKNTNYTISWSLALLDFPDGAGPVDFNVSYAGELLDNVVLSGVYGWGNYSTTFKPVAHVGNLTWTLAVENNGDVIAAVDEWSVTKTVKGRL